MFQLPDILEVDAHFPELENKNTVQRKQKKE